MIDELLAAPESSTEYRLGERFASHTDAEIHDAALLFISEDPADSVPALVGRRVWAAMAAEFQAEAAAIDDAREAAFAALREANERGVTGGDAEAMSAAMAEVDARCEVLRRTYFPQWRELTVALGAVSVVDHHGRVEWVWVRPASGAVQR